MVKHTQTIRRQFADELFECVRPSVVLALKGLNLGYFIHWNIHFLRNGYKKEFVWKSIFVLEVKRPVFLQNCKLGL